MVYLVTTRLDIETPESAKLFRSVGLDGLNVFNELELQIDTETTGLDPHTGDILSIQIGTYSDQYVIDVTRFSNKVLDDVLFKAFQYRTLYFHNAKFDIKWLYRYKATGALLRSREVKIRDTFLMECLLTAGVDNAKRGLKDVAFKYVGRTLDKTVRGVIHREGLSSRVIQYAALDVAYLFDIYEYQRILLREQGMLEVAGLENEVVKVFAKMEYVGVKIDTQKWQEIVKEVNADLKTVEKELDAIVIREPMFSKFVSKGIQLSMFGYVSRGVDINWSSPAQKLQLLKCIDKATHDTADATLQRMKSKHEIVPKLLEYSKLAKIQSSFGEEFLKFVNPVTKRVHPDYWQILSTGRISVKEPNVNQIPSKGELGKKIRACFITEEGYSMVGGDYSGMELRIIAEFSKDPLWLDAFNNGQDLHSVLCSKTFGIDIKDVKTEPPFKKGTTYRDIQKTINFGLAYGMSEYKLSDTMQIPVENARDLIKGFFSVVPAVEKMLNGLSNFGLRNGFIKTPLGRRRYFPEWQKYINDPDSNFKIKGEIERASKNMPIQGTNGDVIKHALLDVFYYIEESNLDCNIILSVYDEIRTECSDEQAEGFRPVLEYIMKKAAELYIKSVPVVVDCSITKEWEK